MNWRLSTATLALLINIFLWPAVAAARGPTVEQVIYSKPDLWGEAALKQPGGPTYEYFEKLLPPLRYVEAPFRIYPIVLSAPAAPVKVRLLGDGSVINALARQPNWRGEMGTPVTFRVGMQRNVFGSDPRRLIGPKLACGYLPIVQMHYRDGGNVYGMEAFADVDGFSPQLGVAFVRFSLPQGAQGKVEALIESSDYSQGRDGILRNLAGKIVACFDDSWVFSKERNALTATLGPGRGAVLAIYTIPGDEAINVAAGAGASGGAEKNPLPRIAAERLQHCADRWNQLLAAGTTIDTPEAVVNNAWRGALIGSYSLLTNDDIRYSHGNQYAKLYIGEGGDATRSIALLGHGDDARRLLKPLFHYTRKNLEFHQAAFKLQNLAHCYRLSRDRSWLDENKALWQKEIDVILAGREESTGMLPREKYCGDIDTMVYSLNSNANCWRALRDMSIVLEETGDTGQAKKLATIAADYRKAVLAALDKAIQRNVSPPFVPIALSGEETAYDEIPAERMGGYWNLMINYVLGSEVFTPDSQTATYIMHYLQQHGGLCMGMLKTHGETNRFWQAERKINDLYGMRYALALLRRDEPDRALVSFYGKLAQGFTRDTFICCEGSDIAPLDEFGRIMYLPPNSAGNANFLEQMRYMLVQDYDLDDDGRAETLRLGFATPRAWLRNGGRIRVAKALTEFGEVSFIIESAIDRGHVDAEVDLPSRSTPAKTLLRMRLPHGKKIVSAQAGGQQLHVIDGETIDLSALRGHVVIRAEVGK